VIQISVTIPVVPFNLFFTKYLLNQSQWTLATIIEDYAVKKQEKK
jgi:hypothetical protein